MELLGRLSRARCRRLGRRGLGPPHPGPGDGRQRRPDQASSRPSTASPPAGRTTIGRPWRRFATRAQVLALQVDQKSRQEAIRLLEQIIDREAAGTADDRFLLAQLLEVDDQWGRARERMLTLLAEEGDNPNLVARYIGWLLMPAPSRSRQPDPDAAKPWIDRLRNLAPDAPQTAEAPARYLAAKGQATGPSPASRHAPQSHPDQLAFAAMLVEELGSPARAEPLYRLLVSGRRSRRPCCCWPATWSARERGNCPRPRRPIAATSRSPTTPEASSSWPASSPAPVASTRPWRSARRPGPTARRRRSPRRPWSWSIRYPATDAQLERISRSLETAMAEHPESVAIPFQLGNLRILQDRSDEAEALFRRSIAKRAERVRPPQQPGLVPRLPGPGPGLRGPGAGRPRDRGFRPPADPARHAGPGLPAARPAGSGRGRPPRGDFRRSGSPTPSGTSTWPRPTSTPVTSTRRSTPWTGPGTRASTRRPSPRWSGPRTGISSAGSTAAPDPCRAQPP